jgi:hypothetical protein
VDGQIRDGHGIEDIAPHVDLRLAARLIHDTARRPQIARRDRVDHVG